MRINLANKATFAPSIFLIGHSNFSVGSSLLGISLLGFPLLGFPLLACPSVGSSLLGSSLATKRHNHSLPLLS